MKKILILFICLFILTGCNKKEVEQKEIKVQNPLTQSMEDFSLDDVYLDAQLKENKGNNKYIENLVFIGDSVPLYYEMTGHITGKQLWHKEGMSLKEVFEQVLYVNNLETGKTMLELFEEKKPKKVIISLGMNSVATMSSEYFIDQYTKLIINIKKISPDTIIIINSIPPVAKSYDDGEYRLNNDSINKYNYYLLKMCSEQKVYFLNTAKVLKDEFGQCKEGYYIDSDGSERAHQTKQGNDEVFKYILNHSI